ncbi:MAG: hypothetical protein AAF550_11625, partial [Myxococcota bacterium]
MTVPSFELETTNGLLGMIATEVTGPVCPLRMRRHSPVLGFHTLMVWSSEPEMTRSPFGENATEVTGPVCPLRMRRHSPV